MRQAGNAAYCGAMSTPDTQITVPFITLPNWVSAAAHCGFNVRPVFDELGIRTDLERLDEATISLPHLGELMERCVARARQHHFPFVLGETFAFDYLPDIATFLATSPTLREAVRVLDWVRMLINPMVDLRLEEAGAQARLVQYGIDTRAGGQTSIYFVESTFAAVVKFGLGLSPELASVSHMALSYPQPVHAARYREHLHLPIRFDQAHDALCFPSSYLDRPLDGGFPDLHGQAERRVDERLARQTAGTRSAVLLEQAFVREPRLLGRGLERMADHLGLHPRTLQRRLQAEGAVFADIQDSVRQRRALADLHNPGLDMETISERLGFSDRRSFTRAFKRWMGMTPGQYRKTKL